VPDSHRGCARGADRASRLPPAPRAIRSGCARPARGPRAARPPTIASSSERDATARRQSAWQPPRSQQAPRERDQRRGPPVPSAARRLARNRSRPRPTAIARGSPAAAPQTRRVDATKSARGRAGSTAAAWRARRAAVGQHGPNGRSSSSRALAPKPRARAHSAGARVELIDARSRSHAVRDPLVGRRLQAPAFLDRPAEPGPLSLARLDLVGELEQVGDVLGRVAELLVGQRAGLPSRVAGVLLTRRRDRADRVRHSRPWALPPASRPRSACRRCCLSSVARHGAGCHVLAPAWRRSRSRVRQPRRQAA